MIFERTGKIAKTHKGVQTLFHGLIKQETAIGSGLAGDLSASYHFKEAADYADYCVNEENENIAPFYGSCFHNNRGVASVHAKKGSREVA